MKMPWLGMPDYTPVASTSNRIAEQTMEPILSATGSGLTKIRSFRGVKFIKGIQFAIAESEQSFDGSPATRIPG